MGAKVGIMTDKVSAGLLKLRNEIDHLDRELHLLLNKRASCALEVAKVKAAEAENGESVLFYRPEREAQVLRNVMQRNQGPLGDETVARLFREIMSACLALEEPMKVGYLGPAGTFTQEAALKHFGHSVESVPFVSIDEVFREVEAGAVNYGVVPVENSTEGVVNHTLDSFLDSELRVNGEVELRIHHHFLLPEGRRKQEIKKIYSHQQSLAQCRKWLDRNWPNVEHIAVSSNAEAARLAANEEGVAAIAGDMAAELYGLRKESLNIEDSPSNTTRFLIIGADSVPPSGCDKTSILVSTRNKPGALYSVLEPFHRFGVSLSRIETRPAKVGTWSYVFFMDFEGHVEDETLQELIAALSEEVSDLRILGSYPRAVL